VQKQSAAIIPNVSITPTIKTTRKLSDDFVNSLQYGIIIDILKKLRAEDEIINESLILLETIKENLSQAKEIAENFGKFTMGRGNSAVAFSPTNTNFLSIINNKDDKNAAEATLTEVSRLTNNLQLIYNLNGPSAINILSNATQIRNAAYIVKNLKERAINLDGQNPLLIQNPSTSLHDNIIVSNEVKSEIKDILFSYMATNYFTDANNASTRLKIMSVGIPNNFTKLLQDRLHLSSQDNVGISSLQRKQSDVVKIKVYKRSMKYDDLIFKPIEFIFDLSVYVTENDLIVAKPSKNELYDNILKKVTISDFENIKRPENYYLYKTQDNKKSILEENKYSFLTNDQKVSLFKNHISSFLLQNYIYLSTGMTVNEENFTTRDVFSKINNSSFDNSFEVILKSYIINVLKKQIPENKSLEQIQNDKSIDKNVRDIIKMYRSGNILCNPDKLFYKAFGAKFFDRVLHIPVNIDSFEIDLEETSKTESGKKLLNQTFLRKNIINNRFLAQRSDRDLILEDFFINIESI
jgi:hypothetical protein